MPSSTRPLPNVGMATGWSVTERMRGLCFKSMEMKISSAGSLRETAIVEKWIFNGTLAQDVIHVNGAFVRTGTQLVGFLKGNDSVWQLGFLARLVKELAQALFGFLIQRLVPALNK